MIAADPGRNDLALGAVARRLSGTGLHSGSPCSVTLSPAIGPIVIAAEGAAADLSSLRVTRADRGVEVCLGEAGVRVDGVEHLLAAFGGLGVASGVRVDVT